MTKINEVPDGKIQEKLDRFKGTLLTAAAHSICTYGQKYHIYIEYKTEEGRITDISFTELKSINS